MASKETPAKTSKKKRNHFLPEIYLDGFAPPPSRIVHVYERGSDAHFSTTPKNAAVETHLYRIDEPTDGSDPQYVEDAFGTWESDWKPALEEARRTRALPISKRGTDSLIWFLMTLITRTPAFQVDHAKTTAGIFKKRVIERMGTAKGRQRAERVARNQGRSKREAAELIERIKADPNSWNVSPPMDDWRTSIIPVAINFMEQVRNYHWAIRRSEVGANFITSDCPVILRDASESPIEPVRTSPKRVASPHLVLPLDPDHVMIGLPVRGLIPPMIGGDVVREVNRILALQSERYVFSHRRRPSLKSLMPSLPPPERVRVDVSMVDGVVKLSADRVFQNPDERPCG